MYIKENIVYYIFILEVTKNKDNLLAKAII
jgi:hypothetical protein